MVLGPWDPSCPAKLRMSPPWAGWRSECGVARPLPIRLVVRSFDAGSSAIAIRASFKCLGGLCAALNARGLGLANNRMTRSATLAVLALALATACAGGKNRVQPAERPSISPAAIETAPADIACTRHVASDGDDRYKGTARLPWRTIQHAADSAEPGDVDCVHGGTYLAQDETESVVTFTKSGTAEAPITFAASPGEATVIQGTDGPVRLAVGISYVRLVGFTVEGFQIWGVTLEGDNHHVILSRLHVTGGETSVRLTVGETEESPEGGPVSNIVLEDSSLQDCQFEAVDCTPGPCNGMIFRRLEIHGAGRAPGAEYGGDGLSLARGEDIVVEDSYIHDNGGDGIDLNSRDRDGNVRGVIVRRNRVVGNHLQGIKLWAGGRIENNLVWGQGIDPVSLGNYPGTYEVVNNTIAYNMYDPGFSERGYALRAAYPEESGAAEIQLTLVNNIFAFNTGPQVGEPTGIYLGPRVRLIEHHNLFWSSSDSPQGTIEAAFVSNREPSFASNDIADGTWTSITGQGRGDQASAPLFLSGWPEVDLHLDAVSPAIDAGSADLAPKEDVEGRPRDAEPDIGAYEQ
jgi:hypothetical protein